MSQDQHAAPQLGIVGDAAPQLPLASARAIAAANKGLGHPVPPDVQAVIDAADAAPEAAPAKGKTKPAATSAAAGDEA